MSRAIIEGKEGEIVAEEVPVEVSEEEFLASEPAEESAATEE